MAISFVALDDIHDGLNRQTFLVIGGSVLGGGVSYAGNALGVTRLWGQPAVNLTAHRTGGKLGQIVSESVEDSHDPKNFLILTNNDYEQGLEDGERDFADETASIPSSGTVSGAAAREPVDDDLAKFTLRKIGSYLDKGTLSIELSNPDAVRLFKDDGSLLYQSGDPSENLRLDLSAASPTSYLADLRSGDVDVWVEGLTNDTDFSFALVLRDDQGRELARDDVHMTIATWTFKNGNDDSVILVPSLPGDQLQSYLMNDALGAGPLDDTLTVRADLKGLSSDFGGQFRAWSDDLSVEPVELGTDVSENVITTKPLILYSGGALSPSDVLSVQEDLHVAAVHNPLVQLVADVGADQQRRVIVAASARDLDIKLSRDVITAGEKVLVTVKVREPRRGIQYGLAITGQGEKPAFEAGEQLTKEVAFASAGLHSVAIAVGAVADEKVLGAGFSEVAVYVLPADGKNYKWHREAWEHLRDPQTGLVPSYWKEVLPSAAVNPISKIPNLRALNDRISLTYATLYNSDPDIFKWAGMAAFASASAGRNAAIFGILHAAVLNKQAQAPAADRPVLPEKFYKFLTDLNWAIYEDIAPQHFAYRSGGIAAVRAMFNEGLVSALQMQGWELIDEAVEAGVGVNPDPALVDKIWEGNRNLLQHEQEITAQRFYDDAITFRMFAFLSEHQWYKTQMKSIVPDDAGTFRTVVPDRPDGQAPNLARYEDRWRWIDTPAVGMLATFRDWSWFHPNITTQMLKLDRIELPADELFQGLAAFPDIMKWKP